MPHFIDRRLNPKDRSLGNRQRFLKRVHDELKRSIRDQVKTDRIADVDAAHGVPVPRRGADEPTFRNSPASGQRDYVLPGNETFSPGDRLGKPDGGGGAGGRGAGRGESDDEGRGAAEARTPGNARRDLDLEASRGFQRLEQRADERGHRVGEKLRRRMRAPLELSLRRSHEDPVIRRTDPTGGPAIDRDVDRDGAGVENVQGPEVERPARQVDAGGRRSFDPGIAAHAARV